MDNSQQIDAFSAEINNQIGFFRSEFKLSVEAMVGVLEIAKSDLIASCDVYFEDDTEEDDPYDKV